MNYILVAGFCELLCWSQETKNPPESAGGHRTFCKASLAVAVIKGYVSHMPFGQVGSLNYFTHPHMLSKLLILPMETHF